MTPFIRTEFFENIFIITINRPEKFNAINRHVLHELDSTLDVVQPNPKIKSVIITGAGEKSFAAGFEINEFIGLDKTAAAVIAETGRKIFSRIENSSKPIIACVNGFALGAGFELALAGHFRIAAKNARFGLPETSLGLMPGFGGTQRLGRLISKGRAMELILTGTMMDAAMALNYGLINHLTEPADLLKKAKEILSLINTKSPSAIAKCIRAVNAADGENENGHALESAEFAGCFETTDAKEGITAFLEKRRPVFKDW